MSDFTEFDQIRLVWTDLNGVPRGIVMPSTQAETILEDGVGFANGVTELTLEPDLLSDPEYGPADGDMMAVPDTDAVVPIQWADKSTAAVFSDLKNVDHTSFPLCARSALRHIVQDFIDEGFQPFVGIELEFSVLGQNNEGEWEPVNTRSSYDLDALEIGSDLIDDWYEAMGHGGYDVTGIHQESQPGQFELNVKYDDALSMADGVMFARHMLKSVSRQHGLKASMMPRPYTDEDANGMHYHLSLWDLEGSENLFASETDDIVFPAGKHPTENAGISDTTRYFIGGLLDHMKALTAICAPTVNSYKRLLPGIWAPINIAWGPDNRSTVLRVPPELGPSTRIEHRVPDSACNPYLGLAATLAAGLDGIQNKTDPGEPTLQNAYNQTYEKLPRTLWSALSHLENNDVLVEALGSSLVEEFLKLKRDEFNRWMNQTSEWEREEYLDEF